MGVEQHKEKYKPCYPLSMPEVRENQMGRGVVPVEVHILVAIFVVVEQ